MQLLSLIKKFKITLLIINILFSPQLMAKGLSDLAPKSADDASEDAKENEEQNQQEEDGSSSSEEVQKKEEPSEISLYLKDKLSISTSTGFYSVKKDSTNWRASGITDIKIAFVLPYSIASYPLSASFRYAPADVSPKIKKDGKIEEYVGIIESYLFGSNLHIPIKERLTASAGIELGMHIIHLKDQLQLPSPSHPDKNLFGLILNGGAEWQAFERFWIGSDLSLGIGTLSSTQIALRARFGF